MLKRLMALVLVVLMLAVVFTSCADDGDAIKETTDEASRYTTTLNLWLIAEEGMDAEQAKAVNDAINKITKQKFRTQLNIKYMTEEGYYAALEKAFTDHKAAIAEAKKNGTTLRTESTSEETILNEYGVPELKYPTALDFQVDILFMNSADKYREYADKGWLVSLDTHLEDTAVKLSYYVNGEMLDAVRYLDIPYGIPNNTTIDEYTYLAVDEELLNDYLTSPEQLEDSVFSDKSYQFLNYIFSMDQSGVAAEDKIYPLYAEGGKLDIGMMHYWGYKLDAASGYYVPDPASFSIFGDFYYAESVRGSAIGCANVLTNNRYVDFLSKKVEYENTEGFITSDPEANAAMKVVKGGWEKKAELEAQGYTVLSIETPRVDDTTAYESMFCVGAYTDNEERSVEILTYLNTNAELRNLLQYGIQDVNYTLNTVEGVDLETGEPKTYSYVTPTADNRYLMDINKTGNVFMAYPDSEEKVMQWEYGKMQNKEATAYPTVGVHFDYGSYKLDTKSIEVLAAVSAAFEERVLDVITNPADVVALSGEIKAVASNAIKMSELLLAKIGTDVTYTYEGATKTVTQDDLKAAIAGMNSGLLVSGKDSLQSVYALYRDWLENSGIND